MFGSSELGSCGKAPGRDAVDESLVEAGVDVPEELFLTFFFLNLAGEESDGFDATVSAL